MDVLLGLGFVALAMVGLWTIIRHARSNLRAIVSSRPKDALDETIRLYRKGKLGGSASAFEALASHAISEELKDWGMVRHLIIEYCLQTHTGYLDVPALKLRQIILGPPPTNCIMLGGRSSLGVGEKGSFSFNLYDQG